MTNTTYAKSNATDTRYTVYRSMNGQPADVLTVVATVAGAKRSVTARQRKGEFNGWNEYGWYAEEKVNGTWIKL